MKKIRNNNSKTDNSRRNFIKTAGITSAGFMILPRHVLGGRGFVAPSDKLNIAAIGAGGKGEGDLREFSKSPNVNIVAFAMWMIVARQNQERLSLKRSTIKISERCWKQKKII